MLHRKRESDEQVLPEICQVRNLEELKENIEHAEKLLICVAFIASWCEPCRKIAKHFPEIIRNFPEVYLIVVNIDDCGRLHDIFNITIIPTFMLIKNTIIEEIFVTNNYTRLKRRMNLHITGEQTELSDIKGICDLLRDEVYMMDMTELMGSRLCVIESIGLLCNRRYLAWKQQSQRFIQAFEKVQREKALMISFGDIDNEDEDEIEPSTSKETKVAKQRKDGRFAKLINLSPEEQEIHLKMKKKIAEERMGSRGSSVIGETSRRSDDTSLLAGTTDDTCKLGIEIEDRSYTAYEVKQILKSCQKVCHSRRIAERKQFIKDMRNMEITVEDVMPFEHLFPSSSEDDLPEKSPRLKENMVQNSAGEDKKLKFRENFVFDFK